ncbi:hypothetical protein HUJ04_010937 [Dendroctonus ponderosae]|nr:hypothetical protein HUJ04_010937 [Dendroctonus ponderosae]
MQQIEYSIKLTESGLLKKSVKKTALNVGWKFGANRSVQKFRLKQDVNDRYVFLECLKKTLLKMVDMPESCANHQVTLKKTFKNKENFAVKLKLLLLIKGKQCKLPCWLETMEISKSFENNQHIWELTVTYHSGDICSAKISEQTACYLATKNKTIPSLQ